MTQQLLADQVLARNGMDVRSQNNWPSVDFDLAESMTFLFLSCPAVFTTRCFINRSGFGRLQKNSQSGDWGASILPDVATQGAMKYRFPDICIVGGGPGLAAAKAALGEGSRSCFWMTSRTRRTLSSQSRPDSGISLFRTRGFVRV